jgi:hypothetical protein
MVIASNDDGIYKDIKKGIEIDLDDKFNIGIIKEIIHDGEDHVFYILANKFDEKLGFFIIRMDEFNPESNFQFLTKYKNKLDIGDCDIFVMRSKGSSLKELVVSFKTIYINTYNIIIYDISSSKG